MTYRVALAFLFAFSFVAPATAQVMPKPDDVVSYDITAEEWVSTKTALVTLMIEAAVTSSNAGSLRAEMTKAVNDSGKGDWRLTGLKRSQDQTGMERWSATFTTRLPEASLNGLAESVKKTSRAGLQIKVGGIDFSPSREEVEAVRSALRVKLFKEAGEQLSALNAALPGRNYRIGTISFEGDFAPEPSPMFLVHKQMQMDRMTTAMMQTEGAGPNAGPPQEVSQKMVLTAHVSFASVPPTSR